MKCTVKAGLLVMGYLLSPCTYAELYPEPPRRGVEQGALLQVAQVQGEQNREYPSTKKREIAIIVNKQNSLSDISLTELRKILKLEKRYWDDGKTIHFVMQKENSWEHETVLDKVYKMEHSALKTYWLRRMFRGKITGFPRTLDSNEMVKNFVKEVRTGIGYIDASSVDDKIKVLRVEGKSPGDTGYALYAEPEMKPKK